MMLGVACYAVEAFELCRSYWNKALKAMRNFKEKPSVIEFELLNNLGCLEYETGNEGSALKRFEESLELQRKHFTCNIYKEGQAACQHMLLKLAITQANIGYVHLRLKNPDAAITAFERSKKVCSVHLCVFMFVFSFLCHLLLHFFFFQCSSNIIFTLL